MSATLTAVILSARQLVGDAPTSNLVRNENLNNTDLGNVINGTNKLFSLTNFPVSPALSGGGVQTVIADGVILSPAAYIVNEPLGQILMTVGGPEQTLIVAYYFYLMDDVAWTEFVLSAVQRVDGSTNNLIIDIQTVPEGLLVAVKQYAAAAWAQRLAGQTGLWYNQRLQERDEQRENISRKFTQLAKQLYDNGDKARDDYYKGVGREFKPSFRIIKMQPRQWTPGR